MTRAAGYARALKFLERFGPVDQAQSPSKAAATPEANPCYTAPMNIALEQPKFDPTCWIPREVGKISNHQTDLPRIAKDLKATAAIEAKLAQIPTIHELYLADATHPTTLAAGSVHLVVTSPPYWTLKAYRDSEGQLGHVSDYENFIKGLNEVWRECFRLLVPGGRLVCVVGDVCLSRRKNKGEHTVVPCTQEFRRAVARLDSEISHPLFGTRLQMPLTKPRVMEADFWGSPTSPTPL